MRFTPLILLGASALAMAQERPPLTTDRPGFSDSPALVAPGIFQFEGGFFRTQVGSNVTTSYGDGLFRFGVDERFELRLIGIAYGVAAGVEEWLDPSLGFKARLVRNDRAEVTLVGQTTLPIGAGSLRSNSWNPTFKLAATTPLGRDTLGGNLVYAKLGSGSERFDQFALSAFLSRPLNSRTGLTGEIWVVDRVSKGGSMGSFASLALTHLVHNDLQVDVRLGTGLNGRRDGWFLQGGFSVRF